MRIALDIDPATGIAPPLVGPERAAGHGFAGIAFADPWNLPAQDLRQSLVRARLPLAAIAAPPPNYAGGPPGWAGRAGGGARFASDLRRVLRLAAILRPELIVLRPGPDIDAGALAAALRAAREAAPEQAFLLPSEAGHLPLDRARDLAATARMKLTGRAEDLENLPEGTLAGFAKIRTMRPTDLVHRLAAMDWPGWVVVSGDAARRTGWLSPYLRA
ncbi:hypothetical protein [Wenxinia saemankumensis]|uniref:Uncharacterized protein n=1 Tax=Wenxinia saemankumensis TaxID=1447782 RepID=A0A1M6C053_9RHOB|nr:hypothetical protein [Wenxinia saemankumensis]SHI54406.1 hypothetical protein SAMN05444417_0938 [Wenxinia saemankumensis]